MAQPLFENDIIYLSKTVSPVEHGVGWAAVVPDDGAEGAEGRVAQLGQRLQARQLAVDHVQVLKQMVQ